MSILEWIDFGKVSAERDDNLSSYFFDNGVLKNVISSPSSFLVLGRKGAGKTAVFRYLDENRSQFIADTDVLVPLSFEDYNWNVHSLLSNEHMAPSMTYKQSWRFVILVECVKAVLQWHAERDRKPSNGIAQAGKLLEKIFQSPIPSLSQIIGRKLLSLSSAKLPKAGLDLEEGNFDSIEVSGGEVSFEDVSRDRSLRATLSENIENIIVQLERAITGESAASPKIFVCFDRVDEAWDDASYEASRKVIAGLVTASDSITSQFKGRVRPILFLREDIFDVLSINDANKLREDCGALLHWTKAPLYNLVLKRVNFFAHSKNIDPVSDFDSLFDRAEMRQRQKPSNYLLRRTMMRPRDMIALLSRVVDSMREKAENPFSEESAVFEKLECTSVYEAEAGYSEWLKQELLDEWAVQRPVIKDLMIAIQAAGSTIITSDKIAGELRVALGELTKAELLVHLRFLYDNSIIGFKLGASTEWRYKCFYPSQGFVEASEYKVHDGLIRALNLTEPREGRAVEH